MDIVSVVGTILAFVVIIVGTILKGSSLDALWNPAAFVIVFLGTLAALLVQTPGPVLKRAWTMLPWVYRPPDIESENLVSRIIGWSEISRRTGLLGSRYPDMITAALDGQTVGEIGKGFRTPENCVRKITPISNRKL